MKPKMILIDLDKTLLRSDNSVSEYTKQIIKKCQKCGIPVVIATARYWIGAERYIREIQPDYEITTDGTLVCRHGALIYSCTMSGSVANQIIQDLRSFDPQIEITVAAGRQVLWNGRPISQSEKLYKAVFNDYSRPLYYQVNKVAAELSDPAIAAKIADKNRCRLQCYRGESLCAFLPKNSGKIQAILALAKLLNISLNDIVSFGDDINDVEMLQICGAGVAVSNAVMEAKNAADFVTASNDEDGVASWIEKNILTNYGEAETGLG